MWKLFLSVLLVVFSMSAHAVIPGGAEALFTELGSDFAELLGYGFAAAVVIQVGILVFIMVQRVARKSAR